MMAAMFHLWLLLAFLRPPTWYPSPAPEDSTLPPFGRNTVLVYRSSNENEGPFVVGIAVFSPERHIEWEDATTQGTIFMPAKAVSDAREFLNYQLFQGGVDTRGKNATTLWLSGLIFRELKAKHKVKFLIDALPTEVIMLGSDQQAIEVNRSSRLLPVIKTRDERGMERWFLDLENNPLLVNLLVRNYQQKLTSITTDRPNTLRWIKDKKR
jgi:hypothetical protein